MFDRTTVLHRCFWALLLIGLGTVIFAKGVKESRYKLSGGIVSIVGAIGVMATRRDEA